MVFSVAGGLGDCDSFHFREFSRDGLAFGLRNARSVGEGFVSGPESVASFFGELRNEREDDPFFKVQSRLERPIVELDKCLHLLSKKAPQSEGKKTVITGHWAELVSAYFSVLSSFRPQI